LTFTVTEAQGSGHMRTSDQLPMQRLSRTSRDTQVVLARACGRARSGDSADSGDSSASRRFPAITNVFTAEGAVSAEIFAERGRSEAFVQIRDHEF
jgi:hypothetical protein